MVKVQQKFFKTTAHGNSDNIANLALTCDAVYVSGLIKGPTASDFRGKIFNTKNNSATGSDIFVAKLDHNGCQKYYKTAGSPSNPPLGIPDIVADCHGVFITGFLGGPTAIDFDNNVINIGSATGGLYVAGLNNCGKQKFFITTGETLVGNVAIAENEKQLFIMSTITSENNMINDFNKTPHQLKGSSDVLVAGVDRKGNQKFFITAGSVSIDFGFNLVTDNYHAYVTGFITAPTATDFAGNTIITYTTFDIFVAGINNCGKQTFFKHAGGSTPILGFIGQNISNSCGDLFVTGLIGFGTGSYDFEGQPIILNHPFEIFVAKLDTCGNQKFFVTAGGNVFDSGIFIADNQHGVFVTGFVSGTGVTDFNGDAVTKLYGGNDIFVAGLSRNNGKQKFFVTAGGVGNDLGINIKVTDDAIYVAGTVRGATATDFNGCPVKNLQGGSDVFVAKLDFCGHQEFFLTAGSSGDDGPYEMIVKDNSIYLSGFISGSTGTDFKHCPINTHDNDNNIFIARLDDLCGKQEVRRSNMSYRPRFR